MLVSIYILGGKIYGRNRRAIGWTEKGKEGSVVSVEVDLRSEKKEERSIRFIVDGKIQKCVIVGLPNEVRYGVWNYLHYTYTYLLYHSIIDSFIHLLLRLP